MLAATSLAIFIVPVLFVLISKVAYSKKRLAFLEAHKEELHKRQQLESGINDPAMELDLKLKKEEEEERKRKKNEE